MNVKEIEKNGWEWMCYGADSARVEELLSEIAKAAKSKGTGVKSVYNGFSSPNEIRVEYNDGTEGVVNYQDLMRLTDNVEKRIQVAGFVNALLGSKTVFHRLENPDANGSFYEDLSRVGHLKVGRILKELRYGE